MKKAFAILFIFFLTLQAMAQHTQRNALKVNPLSMLVMTGNVSYERSLSNNLSVQVGGFYSGAGVEDLKYNGYGIIPELRFYFGGGAKPLNGGFIAPFARYQHFSVTNKELKNKANVSTLGGGVVAGYQKRWESGFILSVFAGPSFNRLNFQNDNEENSFDLQSGLNGFGLRTGLTLGFSF